MPSPLSSHALKALCVTVALAVTPGFAFHTGGVGNCNGCHAVHDPSPTSTGMSLLRYDNPTDLCLSCHSTGHGSTWASDPLLPGPQYGGGSFSSLRAQNLNDATGGSDPVNWIPGSKAGHSIISTANGTVADPDYPAPTAGVSYPANNLHCTSCHDPHNKGGHFRMLYGNDFPRAVVNGQTFTYTFPAPQAVGVDADGSAESRGNHTAYISGMSQWCGNCHPAYLTNHAGTASSHPIDVTLDATMVDTYNKYEGTGFMTGDGTDAYIPEVPVEFPDATTSFRGPIPATARVTCVSCHRAHGSSGPHAGRWDFYISTWADEGVLSGSYRIPNPYLSTSGGGQKQLCEKCHGASTPTSAPTVAPTILK